MQKCARICILNLNFKHIPGGKPQTRYCRGATAPLPTRRVAWGLLPCHFTDATISWSSIEMFHNLRFSASGISIRNGLLTILLPNAHIWHTQPRKPLSSQQPTYLIQDNVGMVYGAMSDTSSLQSQRQRIVPCKFLVPCKRICSLHLPLSSVMLLFSLFLTYFTVWRCEVQIKNMLSTGTDNRLSVSNLSSLTETWVCITVTFPTSLRHLSDVGPS